MFAINDAQKPHFFPPHPSHPASPLKECLLKKKLIDSFFNGAEVPRLPALGAEEQSRLSIWLKKSIRFKFCEINFNAPICDVLFTALNAVSSLPFADVIKIKFVGSFVWSILGRSYLERLFLENDIDLKNLISEKEWDDLERDFNKTHRDIDLSIEMPKANEKNRELIRNALIKALSQLALKYSFKTEKEVEAAIQLALNHPSSGNIVDGNTRYLRTPLGSKELTLDINWFESKGREKLFEEDDISLEVKEALFKDPEINQEIIPSVSSKTLKPFVDLLFNFITVSDPYTVNKRGWAKLLLKELKGKKVLNEKDTITLFNSAFSLFLKGAPKKPSAFSENFSSLIDFCHKEHTLQDFSSHFLLYLQGISSLYYFQNRKDLIFEYENKDIEAVKTEILKISSTKSNDSILELLHSYLEDKEMTIACLFDFLILYKDRYGTTFHYQNIKYTLDLKGKRQSDTGNAAAFLIKKLNKESLSHSELLLAIAVNRFVPKPELKEKILFSFHLHNTIEEHPICDIPPSVFHAIRDNLERFSEKEAVLHALFTHPFVFEYGLKWLNKHQELHYLKASCAVAAFNLDPIMGLFIIKSLFNDLKPKEKKQILHLVFNKLLVLSPIEQKRIESSLNGFADLVNPKLDPELSFSAYSSLGLQYPALKTALTPFLASERFHKEEGFLSRISGSPDELDLYFKSFSYSSLKWLLENQKDSSPQILSIIRTLYSLNKIDAHTALYILFIIKINPEDLPKPLFNQSVDLVLEILSKKSWPLDELTTSERAITIAKISVKRVEFILSLLEIDLFQNPNVSNLIECLLGYPLEEKELKRAWPYALSSNSKALFLTLCLQYPNLESDAIEEMQQTFIEPLRLTEILYRQMDAKKFRLCCLLIRRCHAQLPLDEMIPILMGKMKHFLGYTDAESLFELFQIPEMKKFKTAYAAFIYHRVFQTTSNLLEKRVYSDIRKDFSKDEIVRSLLIPLIRSIGLFSTEEIKAELPFLINLLSAVSDFSPIKTHLAPLARKELSNFEEGKQFITLLSKKSPIFYALETELLIESNHDDQFLEGIKRRTFKRFSLVHLDRLYRIDKDECIAVVKDMENPSLSEQEALFDIFTRAPIHPGFLNLIKEGFFNSLRKSSGRKERLKRLLDNLSAKSALELCSIPLIKEYLSYNGYYYSLKWRDEIINEKHFESLHQLAYSAYEENDKIVILKNQFLHREDLRPKILKEVSLLSQEGRNAFFNESLATIRNEHPHHCLSFFNLFIKTEGFIKNNAVLDLLVLITLHYRSDFKAALQQYMFEKLKTAVALKSFSVNCEEFNIAPLETYQSDEPLVVIPHIDHPTEKTIPKNIEEAFFQILGNLLVKFIQDGCALHKTPYFAGYLLDFAAINLFYRSENIRSHEALRNAFDLFLRPVETDTKKFSSHMRNLKLIESSMNPHQHAIHADPFSIKMHISVGNPLFTDALSFALKPLKEVIHGLIHIAKREKEFAPACILHALRLIRGYNIELFKAYPAIRANHCVELFSLIEATPLVLNEEELNFNTLLNAFFPSHEGLTEKEHFIYSELIQVVRAKCHVLFKNAGLEYLTQMMNLYAHVLEKNYIEGDEHFINIITAIVASTTESLKLSDDAFILYSKKLKDILCLKLSNDKALRSLFTPFIKGVLNQCLDNFSKSDRPIIINFRIELLLKVKEAHPLVFK